MAHLIRCIIDQSHHQKYFQIWCFYFVVFCRGFMFVFWGFLFCFVLFCFVSLTVILTLFLVEMPFDLCSLESCNLYCNQEIYFSWAHFHLQSEDTLKGGFQRCWLIFHCVFLRPQWSSLENIQQLEDEQCVICDKPLQHVYLLKLLNYILYPSGSF